MLFAQLGGVRLCSRAILIESFSNPLDFPGGLDGKASAYSAGDLGSIPGVGRSPGEGNGNGKSHGRWSVVGYSLYNLPRLAKSRTRPSDITLLIL